MKNPQAEMVVSFVACRFFLWFDLPSDWASHNLKVKNVKVKFKCSRFLDSHSKYAKR